MYTSRSRGLYSSVRASPAPTLAASSRMPRIRVVGFERSATDDADRRQLTGPFGIERAFGFLLDDLVDLLEEAEVVGMNAVERRLGHVDEPGLGRVGGGRQRIDPRRQQGVQPIEGADHHPVRIRRRLEHEVPVGNLALMVRRQEQVLAALTAIRPGVAHVGDVALPQIVDEAQRVRRALDHRRTVALEVEERRPVGRLRVRRQHDRCRRAARIGAGDDVRACPNRSQPVAHRQHRRPRHAVQERVDPPHQVERVVAHLDGRRERHPVKELHRAERGLQPVRRTERRQLLCRHTRTRRLAQPRPLLPPDRRTRRVSHDREDNQTPTPSVLSVERPSLGTAAMRLARVSRREPAATLRTAVYSWWSGRSDPGVRCPHGTRAMRSGRWPMWMWVCDASCRSLISRSRGW